MDGVSLLRNLFLKEELSDVRMIVENKTEKANFPAHSLFLKLRSPVIKTMLESDFVEGQTQTVVITDFKGRHIEMFLKFLYTDELPESYTDVCKLVKIAHKFLVSKLTERCVVSLIKFVDLQNVYELCSLADTYSLEKLRDECLCLVKRAAFKLLKSDDLKSLSKHLMEKIVCDDELNVFKEVEVFWAIWRWGELQLRYRGVAFTKENVREYVDDLLKHVRWSLTDDEEKEEIKRLGITFGDDARQTELAPRKPLTDLFVIRLFNQYDTLRLNLYASSPKLLRHNFKPSPYEVRLMRAVSLNESPIFIVGVLFACTKDAYSVKKAELKCSCESSCSVVEIYPFQPYEDYMEITDPDGVTVMNYVEKKYAFPKPIEVRKNQNLNFGMVNNKLHFGTVELVFGDDGKTVSSKQGKKFFIHGNVLGIKKVFLL